VRKRIDFALALGEYILCLRLTAAATPCRLRPSDSAALRRVVRVLLCLASAVTLASALLCACRWRSLQTPVWGVAVQPSWVLVRGTAPVAVVTMALPDVRHAGLRDASLAEKAAYAEARGYWLIACDASLDAARAPVWSKLRLIAAVLEQARAVAHACAAGLLACLLTKRRLCAHHARWRPRCCGWI
jgi:hypothetical protein